MKRRSILFALAILMTPIALSTSPLLASGGDSHEEETESTEVPRSSVPRRDRPRSSVPSTLVSPTTEVDDDDNDDVDDDDNDDDDSESPNSNAPTTSEPKRRRSGDVTTTPTTVTSNPMTSNPAGVVVVTPDSGSDDDSNDELNDDVSGDDESESPESEYNSPQQLRGDLAKNIARATTALNALPQSEARDAALDALAVLQARLEAGEAIATEEVRVVFANVATLVYLRIGGKNPDNEIPKIGHIRDDQQLPRQLAEVNEALRLLDGNTSEAAAAAMIALQEVKALLNVGTLPNKDVFKAAIRLAKDALVDQPAARASMTLAGVLAAIEASDAPEAVKAQLLTVLRAAQELVLNDPTTDARQVVRDALQQVRDARVASAVSRIIAVVDRLEPRATEQNNSDALLLLTQIRFLIQPTDGSSPSRDQLHEARHILRVVLELLGPEFVPTTTVPA